MYKWAKVFVFLLCVLKYLACLCVIVLETTIQIINICWCMVNITRQDFLLQFFGLGF
uniref:Uncharacterized protein n=1 Tax=Arundo donax TaxID=35708 RepID=A0A0A9HMM0_ARUDO